MSARLTTHRGSASVDPDAARFRAASRSIGLRVAALSAAMIVIGAVGLLVALWWKTSRDPVVDPRDAIITLVIDPGDLVVGVLAVAVLAVVVAGLAAMAMARRAVAPLEESMRRQRRFVADASHELRTPIAVVSARAQQLGILSRGDERLAPVVAELRTDCRALSDVVDDLLATAAGGTDVDTPGASELAPVAERVAADLRLLAVPRGVEVAVRVPPARVALDAAELSRALTALLDNAVGHAPDGGHVTLSATADSAASGRVLVRVTDDGPGITGIDPEDVFDRFAHGTAPANPGRSSHGIGLALVRGVAARAGGEARVESTGPTGTTMLLVLPLAAGSTGAGAASEEAAR